MRRGTLVIAILALLNTLLSTALFAQEIDHANLPVIDYKRPQQLIIKDITVSGVKYLDQQILVNLSGLVKNSKISIPGEDITRSIDKLWGQGLLAINIWVLINFIILYLIIYSIFLLIKKKLGVLGEVEAINRGEDL